MEYLFLLFIFGVVLYAIYSFVKTVALWFLGQTDYQRYLRGEYLPLPIWRRCHAKYLKTPHWKAFSERIRKARHQCEVKECFVSGWKQLEAHHLHYKTLGRESSQDVVCLCNRHHRETHGGRDLTLRKGNTLKTFGN